MIKRVLQLVVVLMLVQKADPANATAAFSVAQLERHCRSYLKILKKKKSRPLTKKQTVDIVKCSSFVAGIHLGKIATNAANNTHGPYCLPRGNSTTTVWIIRKFVNWARRYPRSKKRSAAYGVMRSLMEYNACYEPDKEKCGK